MNRSYILAVILAVAVVGWILSGQIKANDGPQGAGAKPVISVETASVENPAPRPQVQVRRSVAQDRSRAIVLLGRTEAARMVQVKAEIAGRISEVPVEKGSRVAKGDVIARIAPNDRFARLKEAQALLEQRQLEYDANKRLSEKNYRSKTKLAQAQALLNSAEATLERIRVELRHTTLRAPFGGVLDARPIEVGDFLKIGVAAGSILDLSAVKISVNVAERDVAGVQIGAPVAVQFSDGRTAQGIVIYVASTSANTTRTFRVEVEVDNADGRLREGLTAKVILPGKQSSAHKLSPAILTLSHIGQVGVKAVTDDHEVVFYPVQLISDTPDGVWLGGLPDELTVITVGQEFVRVGTKVRPIPEAGNEG